ncbi:MAG: metal-dependent hydrolase [Verrucomicrobia bacterium]|jgi:L-ascorbate metabolism protein UlaG (beta-lactamase superfamily)|nr:metal-dependent hydrolase [Verrucomicrobiota bacterium]
MRLIYYGHSCFSVRVGGKTLLFDPYIRDNPLARDVKLDQIPADYILISHGHEDHLADAEAIAGRTGARLISNYEIITWYADRGLTHAHALNHGGSHAFDFGRVKFVNAIHSSTLPDGRNGGNAGGFVVESAQGNFYYSGDTALTLDMKLIGESIPLTFAALCIGDNFTMGIEDAIRASDFIRCPRILGVHYDTFPPIQIDRNAAVERFRAAGKHLTLLNPGEGIDWVSLR